MMNFLIRLIAALVLIVGVGIVQTGAEAQEARVIKVQGKKAIVQFDDGYKPKVGEILGGGGEESGGGSGASSGGRDTIIGGSGDFSSLSTTPGGASTTRLSLSPRYGWNAVDMEYGLLGEFTYQSSTGSSSRSIGIGGFFDYNLVPNKVGNDMVYGLGALGSYVTTATTVGSLETNSSSMKLEVGGQVKWFALGNSVAIRGDGVYSYIQNTPASGSSTTQSGFVVRGGLYVYF
jgi:hypothetical protein